MSASEGDDTRSARKRMVREQLTNRGITDAGVLDAMGRIPRHVFVPVAERSHAYEDKPLPIDCAQTISQPYIVAYMLQLLGLSGSDRVLEIGSGSGYQTALLSVLCNRVVSIERIEALSVGAGLLLDGLGVSNVVLRVGDGTLGAVDCGPFDAIVVSAGGPELPESLRGQLADGGRLVCPVGDREAQRLVVVRRVGETFIVTEDTRCRFVPLIGEQGWDA